MHLLCVGFSRHNASIESQCLPTLVSLTLYQRLGFATEQAFSLTAATILANFDYENHQVRKGSSASRISLEEQRLSERNAGKSECCSF